MKGLLVGAVLTLLAARGAWADAELSEPFVYDGLCEASAAASLDNGYFVVGSDETNQVRIYRRGNPMPIGEGIGVGVKKKSDLEDAARIDTPLYKRIYWISSHSPSHQGQPDEEDKEQRQVLVATDVVELNGQPALKQVGKPYQELRAALAAAAGLAGREREINIEGLAATPEGHLLIGLRSPLVDQRAVVLTLMNPEELVLGTAAPRIGVVYLLPLPTLGAPPAAEPALAHLGIRAMTRLGAGYLIVGGVSPNSDSDPPGLATLFTWDGSHAPQPVRGLDLGTLNLEAIIPLDQSRVQLLSDEGSIGGVRCSDDKDEIKTPDLRHFRSIDVTWP